MRLEMLLHCSKAIPCQGVFCEFMEPEVFLEHVRERNPNGVWIVKEELRRGQMIRGPDGFTVTPTVTDSQSLTVLRRVDGDLYPILGRRRN